MFSWAEHIDRPYGALNIFHTVGSVVGVGVVVVILVLNYALLGGILRVFHQGGVRTSWVFLGGSNVMGFPCSTSSGHGSSLYKFRLFSLKFLEKCLIRRPPFGEAPIRILPKCETRAPRIGRTATRARGCASLRPISLLTLSLLRLLDSNFPGNPLWTWAFHPLN